MEDFEFQMTFFDICGDEATISVLKMGGGAVGKKYEGSWKVQIDGPYGVTDVMDVRNGFARSHFDVAVQSYDFYLQDNEGAR